MKIAPARFVAVALFFAIALSSQAAPPPAADGLRTLSGETIEGRIASVHGPLVVVATKKAHSITALAQLDDASLNKIADFLASQPATPARWEGSASAVAKSLNKRLLILQDKKLIPLSLGDRPEPEFFLAYFSAHWCAPCRKFTPLLVSEYQRLKALHPDSFELVFISSDNSAADQTHYAHEAKMPWPVLKYSATGSVAPLEQWKGRGIPDLIVTNREGHMIFKSYEGDKYVGPKTVLTRFTRLLSEIAPTNPNTRRARHRLEIIVHVRASANSTIQAKPYLLSLDPSRYQTPGTGPFTAKLKLDAAGKVTEVVFTTPELTAVLQQQFRSDTAKWLFLPAAENGQAKESTVDLPVKI